MTVKQLQDVLERAAALLESEGVSERAQSLRALAKAIDPLRAHSVDALVGVLASKVKLDANHK